MTHITYLLESTELWGGTKVVFEQAECLAEYGYIVKIVSKGEKPDWYNVKVPLITVKEFNLKTIPESDILIGTFWPTVRDAFETRNGKVIHFCQGYEGAYKEYRSVKKQIDEVYSLNIPKITVSRHLNEFLRKTFYSQTYYVGQLVNRDIFYPQQALYKRKVPLFRILIVGPFEVDFKNIVLSIKGVLLAKEIIPSRIRLVRVSQFPLSKKEQEIIVPDEYYSHLPYYRMGQIYRSADLYISMSKDAEGFGLPALEAMACGVPAILSKIPSYLGFARKRDYALFVEPSSPQIIATAILKLHRDENLRINLIKRGIEVSKKFTKEKMLSRLQKAFTKIMKDRS
jgi:glycosyltransferase involved in cell wall biosynthesis